MSNLGCMNQFVKVEYNATLSKVICRFHNQTDSRVKSCIVKYGQCGQQPVQTVQGNSTLEAPNSVVLSVAVDHGILYCYTAAATNGIVTIMVEGRIMEPGNVILYMC